MKTKTKNHLIEIIKKRGPIRPFDLSRSLKISPQAVHRHLSSLVLEGVIEPQGKPPLTHYRIVDLPDFGPALHWFESNTAKNAQKVCETRDRFSARLDHFIPFQKSGLSKDDLSLVISASGEIGNNSFDHNMGQWRDTPGCWFEIQSTRNQLWIMIADRGQGIYRSISRVITDLRDEASAVKRVFEENISGRAPEKRGNGLKYVRQLILQSPKRGVACRSGKGTISYGDLGEVCLSVLQPVSDQDFGTITLMAWELK